MDGLRWSHTQLIAVGLLACLSLAGACSRADHDDGASRPPSGSEAGSKKDLCAFAAEINAAAEKATTPAEGLAVLLDFEPRFDQALADAPSVIRPDVQTMIGASREAIEAQDPAAVTSEVVDDAGYRLDQYCDLTGAPG